MRYVLFALKVMAVFGIVWLAIIVVVIGEDWLRSCWRGWRWGDWTGPLDGSDPVAHTGPRPGHIEEQR